MAKNKFILDVMRVGGAIMVVDVSIKKSKKHENGTTGVDTSGELSGSARERFDSSALPKMSVRCRLTTVSTHGEAGGFVLFRLLPTDGATPTTDSE